MRLGHRVWVPLLILVLAASCWAWLEKDWLVAKIYILILDSKWRVEQLQVDRVTAVLGLLPGQKVADIGAGTGLFSRPVSRAVGPEGIVYAVDTSQELLQHIKVSAEREGLHNIRTVLAGGDDPRIPEPVDLIFICDTLHHIEGRREYLEKLHRYLLPSGRLAIIDSPHIFLSSDYSRTQLERWLQEAGYQPAGRYHFLRNHFFLIYEAK